MTLQPPFALFVIAEGVDVDYINTTLTRAYEGNFSSGWDLWVAVSKDPTTAPQDDPSSNELPQGTQPPLSAADFPSPSVWSGKTISECAQWLQSAGDKVALNEKYFTVIDEFSREDDTVLACRIVTSEGKDDEGGERGEEEGLKVEWFPQPTEKIAMEMATNEGLKFDEKASNYQRSRMKDGKPDRSRAGPYH